MKNAKQSVSAIPLPLRKFQQVRSSAILSLAKKLEEAVIVKKRLVIGYRFYLIFSCIETVIRQLAL